MAKSAYTDNYLFRRYMKFPHTDILGKLNLRTLLEHINIS